MQTKAPTILVTCLLASLPMGAGGAPKFKRDIQPILETNCVRCHNAKKTKGGLRMDTHAKIMEGGEEAEAIVPGKPEKSELIIRTHLRPIDEGFMPDEGQALRKEQLKTLTAWIQAGAIWPEGITLTERKRAGVKRVAIP
ncbi:MAG: c-type cytochrome domain-containing protein, partial [Roseibacillus sp.]